jgi:hypothetical protein
MPYNIKSDDLEILNPSKSIQQQTVRERTREELERKQRLKLIASVPNISPQIRALLLIEKIHASNHACYHQ